MISDRDEEIDLIKRVLKHPAGFDLDLFALLWIRWTDQSTIEVEWQNDQEKMEYQSFDLETELDEAAAFFVDKRRELELLSPLQMQG